MNTSGSYALDFQFYFLLFFSGKKCCESLKRETLQLNKTDFLTHFAILRSCTFQDLIKTWWTLFLLKKKSMCTALLCMFLSESYINVLQPHKQHICTCLKSLPLSKTFISIYNFTVYLQYKFKAISCTHLFTYIQIYMNTNLGITSYSTNTQFLVVKK